MELNRSGLSDFLGLGKKLVINRFHILENNADRVR